MVISNRGFCVLSFLCRGREENVEKNEDPEDLEDFGLKEDRGRGLVRTPSLWGLRQPEDRQPNWSPHGEYKYKEITNHSTKTLLIHWSDVE
ncbi:hypothetical protein Peur_003592 [Populus x canadensis]